MKSKIFAGLLLVALCASAPTSQEDDDKPIIVDKDFFPEEFKVYTAEHDIINLIVPLNELNFAEEENSAEDDASAVMFSVQADIKENGKKDYKGVYLHYNKETKLILANGRDAAAGNDNTKDVFFAADDGIYVYDHNKTAATKYGTFDKSSFAIAKINGTDTIYVLTDDKDLYKITKSGSEFKKIDEVKLAEQIVVDYQNNLYFYSPDFAPYVYNGETVKKIEGIPENLDYAYLLKPPFIIDNGVPFIGGNQSYIIYSNGSSEVADFKFTVHPTAYAMEATLIQYAAYNKSIYEYNILAMIFGTIMEQLQDFFKDKQDSIQTIATRSRSNFGNKLLW